MRRRDSNQYNQHLRKQTQQFDAISITVKSRLFELRLLELPLSFSEPKIHLYNFQYPYHGYGPIFTS